MGARKDKKAEAIFNHDKVERAYLELLEKNQGKRPTNTQLVEVTGLCDKAIRNHMKSLKFRPSRDPVRLLTPSILFSLARRANDTGAAAEVKLYLQVVEGWSEKSTLDVNVRDIDAEIERELARLASGGQAEDAGGAEEAPEPEDDGSSLETESGPADTGL